MFYKHSVFVVVKAKVKYASLLAFVRSMSLWLTVFLHPYSTLPCICSALHVSVLKPNISCRPTDWSQRSIVNRKWAHRVVGCTLCSGRRLTEGGIVMVFSSYCCGKHSKSLVQFEICLVLIGETLWVCNHWFYFHNVKKVWHWFLLHPKHCFQAGPAVYSK